MFSFHLICLFDFDFYPYHMSYELRGGCYSTRHKKCPASERPSFVPMIYSLLSVLLSLSDELSWVCLYSGEQWNMCKKCICDVSIIAGSQWQFYLLSTRIEKRIEQTGKVIVKWRHAWILLTVCETHWALMFFADPWTSAMKSCIACSPIILRAWQSFEWVRFHANLTGVQMDQHPYF